MSSYIEIIKIAIISFPFIAFLMSAPFILIQYHKYGSLSFFKALIIYSFVLYFICAYFLIILPLPKISEVAVLTTPRVQLIPFSFIVDFVNKSSFEITNIHTYITALKESYFYVPIYNILLTLPFGIYLRYYFNCNIKKTIFYTFLLSLFFELTQLSGLYFIYPRGYRLFDIDDLMLNTLGGLIGYIISKPIIKKLPEISELDDKAKKRGKKISGFRRTTTFILDIFIFLVLELIVTLIIKSNHILWYSIIAVVYYLVIPLFLNFSTLGEKFLNIKVVDYYDKTNTLRFVFRRVLFAIMYIAIPIFLSYGIENLSIDDGLLEIIGIISIGAIVALYSISSIKYLFTNKQMLYEKISKTKLISTIK